MLFNTIIDNYSEVNIDLFNELERHEISDEKVLTVTFSLIRRRRTCRDKTEQIVSGSGFGGLIIMLLGWWWLEVAVASPCTK